MGCTSNQYGSMERYLVRKARICKEKGFRFFVAYEDEPSSAEFVNDLKSSGGILFKLKCLSWSDLRFYFKLHSVIKGKNIDVIHAYFTPTCHFVMIASFFLGIRKRFRTSANLPYTLFKSNKMSFSGSQNVYIIKQRMLAFSPTRILCRSNSIKEEFIYMGVNRKKLAVVSGGTDTNFFRKSNSSRMQLREKFGLDPEKIIIGTACRLVPIKNVHTFIHCARRLVVEPSNLIFLIIGDGPEHSLLNNLIKKLDLTRHVKMLGHRLNVYNLLNSLDIFVLPSYSEGMSNSILEAMACEVPIIVSDIPPNREIFEVAQDSGLYIGETFDPEDDAELASKVETLLGRTDLSAIGQHARRVVVDHFSLDARIEKELAIYQGKM